VHCTSSQELCYACELVEQSGNAIVVAPQWVRKWIGDSAAWLHTVIASVVRDTWVHARRVPEAARAPMVDLLGICEDSFAGSFDPASACLAKELSDAHAAGLLTGPASLKLLRYLRPVQPVPKRHMIVDGCVASDVQTNAAWLAQLRSQSCEDDMSHPFLMAQSALRQQYASRARCSIGQGVWDAPIVQHEVASVLDIWDRSLAVTPDLLPRAAFLASNAVWQASVWRVVRLCGPSLLASRPGAWREGCMDTAFKRGPGGLLSSYRLLTVRAQMGLLQEAVLATRIRPTIQQSLCPGQSGYIRDVEDPMLMLHELVSMMILMKRMLWLCMGDFEKAFPRTDRSDLLVLLFNGPRIRDGAFALLEDIMAWDKIRVWLSGCSSTTLHNGLPEGGSLGSLLYTTLPDALVRALLRAGFGVGINFQMPAAWTTHVWTCAGTPVPGLVASLVDALKSGGRLPSCALLRAWPALEASGARALDVCAPERVAAVLHADDPLFLASSAGELQRTLDFMAAWAHDHRARFHASMSKSIVMTLPREVDSPPVLSLAAHSGAEQMPLTYKLAHRWLGIRWPFDLSFDAALREAVGRASAACAPLIGLVCSAAVPITLAMEIFEVKVESVLRCNRWLYALSPYAETCLDELFETWSRSFVGAEPWRNCGVARSELGWHLSGFARAVRCVALRRARLWSRGGSDWYVSFFAHTSALGVGWAGASARLLQKWGIADWSDVAGFCPTYASYKSYVTSVLVGTCSISLMTEVATHQAQVPYTTFQGAPSLAILEVRSLGLPWLVQLQFRGWLRLRAGLPCLRALHGRRSSARHQFCIFCGMGVRNGTVHAVGLCSTWNEWRTAFFAASGFPPQNPDQTCKIVLGMSPRSTGFPEAVALCSKIDEGAAVYWRGV
jgi:hypothetical protein